MSFGNARFALRFQGVSKKFADDFSTARRYAIGEFLSNNNSDLKRLRPREFYAIRDIDCDMPVGTALGVTGPRQSGKSTFCAIAGGLMDPDEGRVSRSGDILFVSRPGSGFKEALTVWENVIFKAALFGATGNQTRRIAQNALEMCGLSGSARAFIRDIDPKHIPRLGLAVALLSEADTYIFDDVLSPRGDAFWENCRQRLREIAAKKTLVLSSPFAHLLSSFCPKLLVFQQGRAKWLDPLGEEPSSLEEAQIGEDAFHTTVKFSPETQETLECRGFDLTRKELRARVTSSKINGIENNHLRSSLLLNSAEELKIEFDFFPYADIHCKALTLYLRELRSARICADKKFEPRMMQRIAADGFHFQRGKKYRFKCRFVMPSLPGGVYGLVLATTETAAEPERFKIAQFHYAAKEETKPAELRLIEASYAEDNAVSQAGARLPRE